MKGGPELVRALGYENTGPARADADGGAPSTADDWWSVEEADMERSVTPACKAALDLFRRVKELLKSGEGGAAGRVWKALVEADIVVQPRAHPPKASAVQAVMV